MTTYLFPRTGSVVENSVWKIMEANRLAVVDSTRDDGVDQPCKGTEYLYLQFGLWTAVEAVTSLKLQEIRNKP